ncbi:MAG: hypothetical protein AAFN77_04165 [Planctomycetota bacterium]
MNHLLLTGVEVRGVILRHAIGVFGIALFSCSWKLWTPQVDFPQVPVLGLLVDAPLWLDWIALSAVVMGLVGMAGLPQKQTGWIWWATTVFVVGLSVSILLDQHRLQPWAYQLLILSVFCLTMGPNRLLVCSRWLLVSIYLFSALSKFDYQFAHTIGYQIADALGQLAGMNVEWDADSKWASGVSMAGFELITAILLAIPIKWFRWAGIFFAIALHIGLLLALGPFGLNHYPPVLIWNLFFVLQVILLFLFDADFRGENRQVFATPNRQQTLSAMVGVGVFWFAMLFPLTSYVGIADQWISWELYSPRSSRLYLSVDSRELEIAVPQMDWQQRSGVDWNQWSLDTLGVPVYPQARFQIGCGIAVVQKLPPRSTFVFEVGTLSDRWGGERVTAESGSDRSAPPRRLEDLAEKYWLNVQPRGHFVLPTK